jgi:hypothetical protein
MVYLSETNGQNTDTGKGIRDKTPRKATYGMTQYKVV